ncbi:hypothetical protein M422DRAFT_64878 [Sphaerobolus stellatus SS14]|nr:hypothetical protein M422DRAFT_64878 [Sphaerobolus stellatus SS14]
MSALSSPQMKPVLLSYDVLRLIVEASSHDSSERAIALMCTSKLVQQWAAPAIYHTLSVNDGTTLIHLVSLFSNPARRDWALCVRGLFINVFVLHGGMGPWIARLVQSCNHLERYFSEGKHLDMLTEAQREIPGGYIPAPKYVTLFDQPPRTPISKPPFCKAVTHLCMELPEIPSLHILTELRCLTHFAVLCWGDHDPERDTLVDRVNALLNGLPSLEILLLIAVMQFQPLKRLEGYTWLELSKIKDPRLFARPTVSKASWRDMVRSGSTVWDGVQNLYDGKWRDICVEPQMRRRGGGF